MVKAKLAAAPASTLIANFDGGLIFMHNGNKASGFVRYDGDDGSVQLKVRGSYDASAFELCSADGAVVLKLAKFVSDKPNAPRAKGTLVDGDNGMSVVAFLVPVEGGHALGLAEDEAPEASRIDAANW